jgi:hypothetical protein
MATAKQEEKETELDQLKKEAKKVIGIYLNIIENINGEHKTRRDLASNSMEKYDSYLGDLLIYLPELNERYGDLRIKDVVSIFRDEVNKDRKLF